MQLTNTHPGSLQRLRHGRRRPAVLLAVVCYFLAGAALPPGHMAAPIASGTPFHLCPGDPRSAQLLAAFAGDSSSGHPGHHGHASASHDDASAGADSSALPTSSADPGCAFAGVGSASPATATAPPPSTESISDDPPALTATPPRRRSWLRPPVRSPPV